MPQISDLDLIAKFCTRVYSRMTFIGGNAVVSYMSTITVTHGTQKPKHTYVSFFHFWWLWTPHLLLWPWLLAMEQSIFPADKKLLDSYTGNCLISYSFLLSFLLDHVAQNFCSWLTFSVTCWSNTLSGTHACTLPLTDPTNMLVQHLWERHLPFGSLLPVAHAS